MEPLLITRTVLKLSKINSTINASMNYNFVFDPWESFETINLPYKPSTVKSLTASPSLWL